MFSFQFIYGGIPFLRSEDEAVLREDVRVQMGSGKDRANVDEHFLQVGTSSGKDEHGLAYALHLHLLFSY